MDLIIDFEGLEKIKAELWEGKIAIRLIEKGSTGEAILRGYTDGDKREVIAKLKDLLAAVAKVLGYLDPQGEVGLVEIECRYCESLSDYPVVAQDLFYEARKGVEGAA